MLDKAPALALGAIGATLLAATPAFAQSADGFDKTPDEIIAAQKQAKDEKGDRMPGEKEKKKVEPVDDSAKYDPIEEPGKTYRFIGLRFRDVIVPKFMMNIFADGGRTVNVFMFGPEFTHRKDRLEYDLSIQYADYSMDPFLFKGHDETDEGYELVSSTMKALYFTVDILYDVPIDKSGRFSFLVGGGVGIGAVFGTLYRTQASPTTSPADPNDPTKWRECKGASINDKFCDASNNHYNKDGGSHVEPSWANGGAKPFIFPWIALPQVSFRYKPIKQLQTRADLGFSTSGFFFGLSASYGL